MKSVNYAPTSLRLENSVLKKSMAMRTLPWARSILPLAISTFALSAHADDRYWVNPSDSTWNIATNWSATPGGVGGAGQPANGDNAYLLQSDDQNRVIAYSNTIYPSATLNTLTIASTGSGTITLSQTQDALSSINEYVGSTTNYSDGPSTGTHIQSGGTNAVSDSLILGFNSNGNGFYNLSGGDLTANKEIIGNSGLGTFTQSGGTNTTNRLELGFDCCLVNNSYNLSGGTLNVASEIIGHRGGGNVTQSGGIHSVSGTLIIGMAHDGSYNLTDGSLVVSKNEYIGEFGTGTFIQTGGTHSVGELSIGPDGGNDINNSYTLSGGSLIVTGSEAIAQEGSATFSQSGGNHVIKNSLRIADHWTNGGYTLSGGSLSAASETIGGNIIAASQTGGTGVFTQTDGTHTVTNSITLAPGSTSSGTYNLNGGTLNVGQLVRGTGAATFNWTAGTLNFTQALSIGSGQFFNNLNVGHGKNLGTADLNIAADGAININDGGSASVSGNLVNNGQINVDHATLKVDGTLTQNGALVTDPSTITAGNLVVGVNGYIQSAAGDALHVNGNFQNNSSENLLWNTRSAGLFLDGNGNHIISLAGVDLDASSAGYTNNFAWGKLDLASGGSMVIVDGNATVGAALYVGLFELADGLTQLSSIISNYNIYYDASLAGNSYLGGLTYALNGTGHLIGISSVPVPAAVWLFGSSLLGLTGLARKRKTA